jgi:hypothetical protein
VSQEPAESRALNDKWPPKNLDIPGNRRYHSWHWSGAATESQYRNTNRKGNRHPKSGGLEEHYDDDEEEEYHYGPSHSKNNKRPSETEFHHMVKMPKHSKVSLLLLKGLTPHNDNILILAIPPVWPLPECKR